MKPFARPHSLPQCHVYQEAESHDLLVNQLVGALVEEGESKCVCEWQQQKLTQVIVTV